MGAKARLDMGDRNPPIETGERPAERARGVALDDDQGGRRAKLSAKRFTNLLDMGAGIGATGAAEIERGEPIQPERMRIEPAMLAGEDEQRRQPAPVQRVRDR